MNYLDITEKIFTMPFFALGKVSSFFIFSFLYGIGLSVIFCIIDLLYLLLDSVEKRASFNEKDIDVINQFPIDDLRTALFHKLDTHDQILSFGARDNLLIVSKNAAQTIEEFYKDFKRVIKNGSSREIYKELIELMSSNWFILTKEIRGVGGGTVQVGQLRLFLPSLFKDYINLSESASVLEVIRHQRLDKVKETINSASMDQITKDFTISMYDVIDGAYKTPFQTKAISVISRFLLKYLDQIAEDIKKQNAPGFIKFIEIGYVSKNLFFKIDAAVNQDPISRIVVNIEDMYPSTSLESKYGKYLENEKCLDMLKQKLLDEVVKYKNNLKTLVQDDDYSSIVSKITLPNIVMPKWGLSSGWIMVLKSNSINFTEKEEVIK